MWTETIRKAMIIKLPPLVLCMGDYLVQLNCWDSEPRVVLFRLKFHIKRWIKGQIVSSWQYATIGSQLNQVHLAVVYSFPCIYSDFSQLSTHTATQCTNTIATVLALCKSAVGIIPKEIITCRLVMPYEPQFSLLMDSSRVFPVLSEWEVWFGVIFCYQHITPISQMGSI